jgi:hypothetical protein
MPAVSIWMIRFSLIYLILTFVTGAAILVNKAFVIHPAFWALLPVHIEIAILGWVFQFVLGTAYWMFPRYLKIEKRGSIRSAWLMVIALNLGVIITSLSFENTRIVFAGRILLAGSVFLFIKLMWNRVVSYRKHGSART